MAEHAVASAIGKLGVLLGQALIQEATFLSGVRDDVEWLRSELRWMDCFLKDAAAKGRGDERMKNWMREVRDVAYQAEDVVDIFRWRIERRRGVMSEFFRRYAFIPSDLIAFYDIGNEILQIKSRMENIRKSREEYGILNLGENRAEISGDSVDDRLQARRQRSPRLHDEPFVVGFDVHRKFILEHLLDANVKRSCVISVVGMGGLGKTTLAAKVYNSKEVKSHFTSCAWIIVSQEYRVNELMKNIIKQVMGSILIKEDFKKLEKMTLDELMMKLSYFLQHKRYFIVLDDIWEQAVWEQIKDAFPNAENGSRLLFTTRFMDVAKLSDPRMTPYQLPFLSDEESWELVLKVVFPSDSGVMPSCPMDLEEMGKELVKRCSGLPLALVVLGGLLLITDPTADAWREVAENNEWESTIQGKECLQILAFSYNHLPHCYLKSCFLYLGCFPEDYKIKSSQVIRLWIAEGFIPQKENRTMEETAKGYLDELARRCMIQVADRSVTDRRIKSFRIHDLFRDWCIVEAKEEGFFRICSNFVDSPEHDIVSSRRLVLYGELSGDIFCSPAYKARTILGFNLLPTDKMFVKNVVRCFKLLRVIYLHFQDNDRFHKNELPKEISSLIHLKHIAIIGCHLMHIPSTIGKLCSLQIFYHRGGFLSTLPTIICTIETLQHIDTRHAGVYVGQSPIGRLRSLQTLRDVHAGSWIKRDLAKLSNLRKLSIDHVRETHVTVLFDSLPKLNHLSSLHLDSGSYRGPRADSLFAPFPSHRQLYKLTLGGPWTAIFGLPQNLISLNLHSCLVDQDVISALGRLPSLSILHLDSCEFAEEGIVCSSGGFPRLQRLHFGLLKTAFKYWRIESGSMPMLTYFTTENHISLGIPDELMHVALLHMPSSMTRDGQLNQFLKDDASTSAPEMANTITGSFPADRVLEIRACTCHPDT